MSVLGGCGLPLSLIWCVMIASMSVAAVSVLSGLMLTPAALPPLDELLAFAAGALADASDVWLLGALPAGAPD